MKRIAVIDIGSNAVRGTVAEVIAHDAVRVVADERIQTQLALGLVQTGELAEDRMAATIEAIAHMVELAASHDASTLKAIATASVRSASNGATFVQRVELEWGVPVEVIDGDREATLAFVSAAASFDLPDDVCIADIGGGSLEVVIARDGEVEAIASLPLGAVTFTARLAHLEDPPGEQTTARLRAAVRDDLSGALGPVPRPAPVAICSGGTITSLVGAAAARRGLSPLDIHGIEVSIGEIEAVASEVASLPAAERGSIPGIPSYRAETVLAGSLVMSELFSLLGTQTVIANRRGIREGLLLEMAASLSPPG